MYPGAHRSNLYRSKSSCCACGSAAARNLPVPVRLHLRGVLGPITADHRAVVEAMGITAEQVPLKTGRAIVEVESRAQYRQARCFHPRLSCTVIHQFVMRLRRHKICIPQPLPAAGRMRPWVGPKQSLFTTLDVNLPPERSTDEPL